MAVKKETSISRYIGDTADVKPTSVPVGSTYLDRQTGALYITYDGTNWAEIDKLIKLVAGTALVGKVGIDQATANANEVVVKSGTVTAVTAITNALPAGEAHIGQVGGKAVRVSATVTRPDNADAYAAGDSISAAVGAPIEFAGCARVNAGSGLLVGATLIDSANQAVKGAYELWLFSATVAVDNDNAPYTPTDAELLTLVGVIPFNSVYVGDATVGAGGNCVYPVNGLNLPFVCGAASTSLFGALVPRNAYTPVALETFSVMLTVEQN